MPLVTISATYPILTKSRVRNLSSGAEATFNVCCCDHTVVVTVLHDESHVTATIRETEISEALLAWLSSTPRRVASYPKDIAYELLAISSMLEAGASTVVEAIKYLLNRPEIPDKVLGLMAVFVWSESESEQRAIPILGESSIGGFASLPLGADLIKAMQIGLDKRYKPLAGMRHLFRAMQEEEPRFRWIDATIALELAIKEALIRKHPDFETLLLEMPSPPLDKLYGPIMKKYLGAPSPYLKDIREGASIRNKLVHRPYGISITKEEAVTYIHQVHKAINHLFAQLYPDWTISNLMQHAISRF